MKQLLTLLVLLLSGVTALAQGRATLKVNLTTNKTLAVAIDDRYYERRGTSLTVENIPAGRHMLKVYQFKGTPNGNTKGTLVYSGYVTLKQNTFNNAVVDPVQKTVRLRSNVQNKPYQYDNRNSNDIYENWNDRRNFRRDDDDKVRHYTERRNDDNRNNRRVANTISEKDITELGTRVKDRITDGDKVNLMQSVLDGRQYTTTQLRRMFDWLSFESTKLDFAKWAYANTIDKENYWKLEDIFSFSSSKDDLQRYIQKQK